MKTIGKYQVLDQIGSTAAGATYRVLDAFQNRELVVKVLTPPTAVTAESKNRFCAKLAACAGLKHRHIAGIHDLGEVDGAIYVATGFSPGLDLRRLEEQGTLSLEQKLRLVAQIAEGLAFAHGKGIAHGNLKPRNIFAPSDQEALLLDFGTGDWLALLLAAGERLPGLMIEYFSPEQILGQPIDARSDVFSLGVILYELIGCQHPFPVAAGLLPREIVHAQPVPLRKLEPQAPESLEGLIINAMAKNPLQRLQSADEFATALYVIAQQVRQAPAEAVAASMPVVEPPPAPVAPPPIVSAPPPPPPAPAPPPPTVSVEPPAAMPPPPPVAKPAAPQPAPRPQAKPVASKSKRMSKQVITIAVAAILAIVIAAMLLTRQSLHASPPKPSDPVVQAPVSQSTSPAPVVETPRVERAPAPVQQPAAEPPKPALPVVTPSAELILRTQVQSLWESGDYARAMQVVDTFLQANPASAEARTWKKKIRAAQDAEEQMK